MQFEPLRSVAARSAAAYPDGRLILRAGSASDALPALEVEPRRIAWIETPLAITGAGWPAGVALDVVVADPAAEAPSLYGLAALRGERPVRVTLPVVPGVARAARIAMALQLPLRLLAIQPAAEALADLHAVLERWLHDPHLESPVQPFDAALAFWLNVEATTFWMALDQDPAYVCRMPDPVELATTIVPHTRDFVPRTLDRLVREGAECAGCPFQAMCAGFFKWPDPAYRCDGVRAFLEEFAESARAIARDLDEARRVLP